MCSCILPPSTEQQGPHTHPYLPSRRAQHRVSLQLLPLLEKISTTQRSYHPAVGVQGTFELPSQTILSQ